MNPRAVLTLLVCAFCCSACSDHGRQDPGALSPHELRVGIEDEPQTLDPRYATDAHGQRIRQLLWNSLVQHDYELKIVPELATGWETPDETTYVFSLRDDVRFHNGDPLSARDVKATFEHLMDPETASPFAAVFRAQIKRIVIVSPTLVRFELQKPSASFLTNVIFPILPHGALQGGGGFENELIGTGPFRFVSQSPTEIVLESFAGYHAGSPQLDRVVIKVVKDESTRFLKLRKGDLDILINALPEHKLDELEAPPLSELYRVIEEPGLSYEYVAFNLAKPRLRSLALRRAIAHGINVDELITHRLYGHAQRAKGLLSPVNWFHESEVATYDYDPETARQLLEAAGLSDPDGDGPEPRLSLELKTSNNQETLDRALILQAQLAQIGIRLDLKSYEWGTFFEDVKEGNFELTLMRWIGFTDPDFYYDVFHSSQIPPGRNRGRYSNPLIDRLVEDGRIALDPEERRRIYSQVQRQVALDLPYVSLWHRNNVAIIHRRVNGYRQHPRAGLFSFKDITLTAE